MADLDLENRIRKLEQWKEERERQQITFPLDFASKSILDREYLSVITSFADTSATGNEFRKVVTKQNGLFYVIPATALFITVESVDITNNILTLGIELGSGLQGSLDNDTLVVINSTGTAPAGLDNGSGYFVVNSTGTTIKLSATLGGAAIDITDTGTGQHYISVN